MNTYSAGSNNKKRTRKKSYEDDDEDESSSDSKIVTNPNDDVEDDDEDGDPDTFKIKHKHDGKFQKLLQSRGVSPVDLIHNNRSFILADIILPIEAMAFGKLKKIQKLKQWSWYYKSYKKVLGSSWLTAGIGGTPSDLKAKQIALHLFIKAIHEYQARDLRRNTNRSLPYWHHVYGGFGDPIRDMKDNFPSFLVVSNITPECTAVKLEKVRDICTKFNNLNIPVVVVCAGMDPYTLFATKLYYPMRWGLFVGNPVISL